MSTHSQCARGARSKPSGTTSGTARTGVYRRRRPETTALESRDGRGRAKQEARAEYRVVQTHFETWLAERSVCEPIPRYVEQDSGNCSCVALTPASLQSFAVTSIVGSWREVSRAHFVHRAAMISCWRSHAKAAGSVGHVMRVAWPTTAGMQEVEQCRNNCRDRSPSGRARLPPGAGGRSCASCARGINASMHVTPVGDLFSQAPAILSASGHGVDRVRAASVATRRRGEAARMFTGRTR